MSIDWATDQALFMEAGGQTVTGHNQAQADRYLHHIHEEVTELWRDHGVDKVKALDGAVDTIVVCLGYLISIGIDPRKAWDAVHAANMRKVVDGKLYRREDGQIGKPPGWYGPEEELKALVNSVELVHA